MNETNLRVTKKRKAEEDLSGENLKKPKQDILPSLEEIVASLEATIDEIKKYIENANSRIYELGKQYHNNNTLNIYEGISGYLLEIKKIIDTTKIVYFVECLKSNITQIESIIKNLDFLAEQAEQAEQLEALSLKKIIQAQLDGLETYQRSIKEYTGNSLFSGRELRASCLRKALINCAVEEGMPAEVSGRIFSENDPRLKGILYCLANTTHPENINPFIVKFFKGMINFHLEKITNRQNLFNERIDAAARLETI